MLGTLLYAAGVILILLGVLNLIGVFVFGTIGGVGLIVLGVVLLVVGYFLTGTGTYTRSGRRGL
jgi:hypothetical protein